jgi:hypothetical protein
VIIAATLLIFFNLSTFLFHDKIPKYIYIIFPIFSIIGSFVFFLVLYQSAQIRLISSAIIEVVQEKANFMGKYEKKLAGSQKYLGVWFGLFYTIKQTTFLNFILFVSSNSFALYLVFK